MIECHYSPLKIMSYRVLYINLMSGLTMILKIDYYYYNNEDHYSAWKLYSHLPTSTYLYKLLELFNSVVIFFCINNHLLLKKAADPLLQLLDLRGLSEVVKDIKRTGSLRHFHRFNAFHERAQELLIDGMLLVYGRL
jgi:hypothetical protein